MLDNIFSICRSLQVSLSHTASGGEQDIDGADAPSRCVQVDFDDWVFVWTMASAPIFAQFCLLIPARRLLMRLLTCVIQIPTNQSFFRVISFPPFLRSRCCRVFFDFTVPSGLLWFFWFFRSLMASLDFVSLPPFVNPSTFPSGDLTISDYKNVVWPISKHNAVCMMFGAVYSCDVIHYAMAGPNKIRAITIIPSATAFDSFRQFLGKQYAADVIYGPFDYGCLLTFTSRREGLTSSCWSSNLAS